MTLTLTGVRGGRFGPPLWFFLDNIFATKVDGLKLDDLKLGDFSYNS